MDGVKNKRSDKNSVANTLLVAFLVSLGCAILVSSAAVLLKPKQLENRVLFSGVRNVLELIESLHLDISREDAIRQLEVSLIDLDSGAKIEGVDAVIFDQREALKDPEQSVEIPLEYDIAKLNRRTKLAQVYELRQARRLRYVIVPISGAGMWSTIYGYIAINSDLNTIAAVTFYEHGETPGIGDKIQDNDWLKQWRGRAIYESNDVLFEVGKRTAPSASNYQVDAITGATITSQSTGTMIRYWFGEHGFRPYLARLREEGKAG